MMLDAEIVAVSPSTVRRVLHDAGRLKRWNPGPSKKGTGFDQPAKPHEHWHIDISYLNINGTFYYLCSILDGYSRAIVHWEIRESMPEENVELIVQRALEKFPGETPRVISDNGPQFIARNFKSLIRILGMTHVRTSPYYPQSNGKIERWHQSLKRECIRPKTPLSLADARHVVADYVRRYNVERLHSALDYIAPADKLAGRGPAIKVAREGKLRAARAERKRRCQLRRACQVEEEECPTGANGPKWSETEAGNAGEQPAEG